MMQAYIHVVIVPDACTSLDQNRPDYDGPGSRVGGRSLLRPVASFDRIIYLSTSQYTSSHVSTRH